MKKTKSPEKLKDLVGFRFYDELEDIQIVHNADEKDVHYWMDHGIGISSGCCDRDFFFHKLEMGIIREVKPISTKTRAQIENKIEQLDNQFLDYLYQMYKGFNSPTKEFNASVQQFTTYLKATQMAIQKMIAFLEN